MCLLSSAGLFRQTHQVRPLVVVTMSRCVYSSLCLFSAYTGFLVQYSTSVCPSVASEVLGSVPVGNVSAAFFSGFQSEVLYYFQVPLPFSPVPPHAQDTFTRTHTLTQVASLFNSVTGPPSQCVAFSVEPPGNVSGLAAALSSVDGTLFSVALSWQSLSQRGSIPILHYTIFGFQCASLCGEEAAVTVNTVSDGTSITVTTPEGSLGGDWCFVVVATNGVGSGPLPPALPGSASCVNRDVQLNATRLKCGPGLYVPDSLENLSTACTPWCVQCVCAVFACFASWYCVCVFASAVFGCSRSLLSLCAVPLAPSQTLPDRAARESLTSMFLRVSSSHAFICSCALRPPVGFAVQERTPVLVHASCAVEGLWASTARVWSVG